MVSLAVTLLSLAPFQRHLCCLVAKHLAAKESDIRHLFDTNSIFQGLPRKRVEGECVGSSY